MQSTDIAWLAGLLEGEACFTCFKSTVVRKNYRNKRNYTTTCYRFEISLRMNDADVVYKAADLLKVKRSEPLPSAPKLHRAIIAGRRAIGWMMTIYPFMGERRRARIKEIIAVWKTRPIYNLDLA